MLVADERRFGRIPVPIEAGEISRSSSVSAAAVRDYAWVAMQGAAESPTGSGRAVAGLAALARFPPRLLVLDLADQLATHLRERMIEVALVGGGHQVRPAR